MSKTLKEIRESQLAKYEALIAEYKCQGPGRDNERLFWIDMMSLYEAGIIEYETGVNEYETGVNE